jgi:DNA polymerase III delta prime subunit
MTTPWINKYEPKTLDEMVLHPETRAQLARVLKKECSVTLYSKPGMGKGTFANVYLREADCESLWVNASFDNGIDFIRERVQSFAYGGLGFSDRRKLCIFNEADRLTDDAQSALKEIIERSAKLTLFWFLTNVLKEKKRKLDDAILSRAPVIEFKKAPEKDILRYVSGILKEEGVEFIDKTVMGYITRFQGDIRRIINEVENHVVDGRLQKV